MRFGEQAHQLVLAAVGVLILVDHDVAQAAVPGFARGLVVAQQAHGFEQQIVEIERVGLRSAFSYSSKTAASASVSVLTAVL